jgi:hypothetical protein
MKLFGTAIAGIMIATSLLPAYAGDDDRRNQSNNTNTVNNTNSNSFTNNNANTSTNTNSNANSNTNTNNNTNTNTSTNTNDNSNSNNVTANGGNSNSTSTANGGTSTSNSTSTANGGTGGTSNSTSTANGGTGGTSNSTSTANGGTGGTGGTSNSTSTSNGGTGGTGGTGGKARQQQSNSIGAITNTLVNQGSIYYPDWINVSPSQSSVSMSSASCQGPTLNGTAQTLETNPWNNEYGVQGSIGISIPLGGQKDCYAIQSSLRKRALFENAANTALMCSQLEKMNVKFDDARFPELSSCLPPVVSIVK